MKKIITILVLMLFVACASLPDYPQPVFDKPHSYVFDISKIKGTAEDYIKIYNASSQPNARFRIYIHDVDSKEWKIYGSISVEDSEEEEVSPAFGGHRGDLEGARYFAIESLDGKDFNYSIAIGSHDLHITVVDGESK